MRNIQIQRFINALGFQVGWFICIASVKYDQEILALCFCGILVGLHFLFSLTRSMDLKLSLIGLLIGLVIDSTLQYVSVISFYGWALGPLSPFWLWMIWVMFALTLNSSLSFLQSKHVFLSAIAGLIFGPLSYLAGVKLGAAGFDNTLPHLVTIGLIWMLVLPRLYISQKIHTHHPRIHTMQRRKLLLSGISVTAASLGLMGCAGPSVQDYVDQKPALDLKTYFNGTVDAWGMFTDRNGKVVKRFTVEMKCQWNNDQGILDEDFVYSDGKTEKRIWKLTDKGNGFFTGTAGDVVGIAEGQAKGNAFNWSYTLALPVDGSVLNVQMDDWMYLMNDRVMLNKARMTKLGIHLGDVTLSFMKRA